ncbi:hypothetical protein CMV_018716 [Castanea mollissima]|uniref:Uncharacterized protein n=1 Tax=Castanea mollissima TaxID=60419 RepID=A0A8J4QR80_9ROSI|nr:hypothetical protein CMV_018716 [Castanea mollissima]
MLKSAAIANGFLQIWKKGGVRKVGQVAEKATTPSREAKADINHANKGMKNVTATVEVKFGETFNAPEISKLKPTNLLNGDLNRNKGDLIEKLIKEIDKELNGIDISGSKRKST